MTSWVIPSVEKVQKTCSACPAQWEVELTDGRMVYVRYRHGYLSIRVSPEPTTDIMEAVGGKEIYGTKWGDGYDGFMETAEMLPHLKKALEAA